MKPHDFLDRIRDKKVLVIGDAMVDTYIEGVIERISPEAPVPILNQKTTFSRLGGAANSALNLKQLGLSVILISAMGNDENGRFLSSKLIEADIELEFVITEVPTTCKTRLISGGQQLLRVDQEQVQPLNSHEIGVFEEKLKLAMNSGIDAILVSDYGKGFLNKVTWNMVVDASRELQIPIHVDPKYPDLRFYIGATSIKPNSQEMKSHASLVGGDTTNVESFLCSSMSGLHEIDWVIVTQGSSPVILRDPDSNVVKYPVPKFELTDVSGAGDTFSAMITAALAAKIKPTEVTGLACLAASTVCRHLGTIPITQAELMDVTESISSKGLIVTHNELEQIRANHPTKTIVFTNGCFDMLHSGHLSLLEQAKSHGDLLIVGVNSDNSVRKLKGEGRPVISESERVSALLALRSVDYVIVFDDETPLEIITTLNPSVLVKGNDYAIEDIVGASFVMSNGGKIVSINRTEGISTTSLIERFSK